MTGALGLLERRPGATFDASARRSYGDFDNGVEQGGVESASRNDKAAAVQVVASPCDDDLTGWAKRCQRLTVTHSAGCGTSVGPLTYPLQGRLRDPSGCGRRWRR